MRKLINYGIVFLMILCGVLGRDAVQAKTISKVDSRYGGFMDSSPKKVKDVLVCSNIYVLNVEKTTESLIKISWNDTSTSSMLGYEVAIVVNGGDLLATSPISVSDTFFTFTSLSANTEYMIGVRRNCGSGVYSDWSTIVRSTTPIPNTLPFMCDFESLNDRNKWVIDNENLTNKWVMSTGTHCGEGSQYSLYISGDEIANSNTYDEVKQGVVFAKCLVQLNVEGEYNIEYDWKCAGENYNDYMRAMLVPVDKSDIILSGTSLPSGITSMSLPSYMIAVDKGSAMCMESDWVTYRNAVRVSEPGNYYLCFMWYNNSRNGVNPPAAIDNIKIEHTVCNSVDSVSVTNIVGTSVKISAFGNASNQYKLYYKNSQDIEYDTLLITSPYTLNNLDAGTLYDAIIRSSCGNQGDSYSSYAFQFGTTCEVEQLPWAFDAECAFVRDEITAAQHPYCWDVLNKASTAYCWKSASSLSYVRTGSNSLYFYGSTSTTPHDDWLFTPIISFTGSDELSFWVKSGSSSTDIRYRANFTIYFSDSNSYNSIDTSNYSQMEMTGDMIVDNLISISGGVWQKITIPMPTSLIGLHRLAFVVKGINSYRFCIDDMYIYTKTGCEMPEDVHMTTVNSSSATISWTGQTSSYKVYYGEPGFDMNEVDPISVDTNMVVLTGLNPNTLYEVRVAAACSETQLSSVTYPYNFTTTCSNIPIDDLPFFEDFQDNIAGPKEPLDDCWYKGNNSTGTFPYIVENITEEGSNNVLFLSSSTRTYSYVALPSMEEDVSNLALSCSVLNSNRSTYSADLVVGLMRNPYDFSTFTAYDTLHHKGGISQWTDFQISLSNFDIEDGTFITFCLPMGKSGTAYLDNIKVLDRGSCDFVTNMKVDAVGYNEATVSWDDNLAHEWTVYYGNPGFSIDTVSNHISVYATPIADIIGLSPQKTYEFVVVAKCADGGTSAPSLPTRFTTTCAPIDTIPYLEDFEAYGEGATYNIDPCWITYTIGTTANYVYPDATVVSGSRSLFMKSAMEVSNHYYSYAVLPMLSTPIDSLKINFKMKSKLAGSLSNTYYSKLAVGVISNPNDLSTFDTVAIVDMSTTVDKTIEMHEVVFNTYEGLGKYIALVALPVERGKSSAAYNQFYLDDIVVDKMPTCYRPTNLKVSSITAYTVDLSWEGNASSYQVMYSTHADMSDSTVVVVNASNTQLTGLDSYSFYYINVRGICSAIDTSEWMIRPIRIHTAMDCGIGYQHLYDVLGNGELKNNYNAINGNSGHKKGTNWMIFTAGELAELGILGIDNRIHSIAIHTADRVVETMPLRVYMAETKQETFSANLSDTMALSQMTMVYDGKLPLVANEWNEMMFTTPFIYSDTANLMIAFERDTNIKKSTDFYVTLNEDFKTAQIYTYYNGRSSYSRRKERADITFNMCGEVPNCVRPTNIVVSNIMATSVDLSWEASANQYQIIAHIGQINPNVVDSSQIITVNGTSTTLQNLSPNEFYYIYLRSICADDTSYWTRPIEIKTPCVAVSLPYTENFDSYPATTIVQDGQIINTCWVKGTNGTIAYPHVTTQYASSLNNSLRFYSNSSTYSYVALPMIDTSFDNIEMNFAMRAASGNKGCLKVGVTSDPYDISTFQQVALCNIRSSSEWENHHITFDKYEGTGRYITFLMPDSLSAYLCIDDITIFAVPTCQVPTDLEISETTITGTSAIVKWTDHEYSPAGGFELEYGPTGFEVGTGIRVQSNTNPTTLTNLSIGTCYDVYVRVICSDIDTSMWSLKGTFCTNCEPVQLPITYNFDNFEPVPEFVPYCFNRYNDASTTMQQKYPYILQDMHKAHSGTQCLYFQSNIVGASANNASLIFPEIDTVNAPMNGNQMTFWGKSGSFDATIYVGIISNLLDYSSLTILDSIVLTNEYTEYTVSFEDYTGTGVYPILASKYTEQARHRYIDDVTIEKRPACPRVYNLHAVGSTTTTATVGWSDTIGSTQWVLDYHQQGSDEVTTLTVNSNPYTITNLLPLTKYFFNVRPICASGDTSAAVSVDGVVRTSQAPITVPYRYNFEDATEWSNWQSNSNCDITWYRGTATAGQDSTAMYISKNAGNSCSSDWRRSVNAVVYRDIDFGTDTASYVLTFKASVGGTDLQEIDGVSVLLVNSTSEVNSSNDNGVTPWGHVDSLELFTIRQDTAWNDYYVFFDNVAGVKRVVFYWYNQSSEGIYNHMNMAGAIDDIAIVEQTCLRPVDLTVSNIEDTSATLSWTGQASQYEVAYGMVDDAVVTNQVVQGNRLDITHLQVSSDYMFKVRAICNANDTSYWSDIEHFSTICHRYVASDSIFEDFSNVDSATYDDVNGSLPECWDSYSNGTNGVRPHVNGYRNSYWYCLSGNSLVMTAGYTFGDQVIVRLPHTAEPMNTLKLSYWMCSESSREGSLEVGYLNGPNFETDFVALKTIHVSDETVHANLGMNIRSGFYDTVYFDSVPLTAQTIAFRWNGNIAPTSVCLDNIVVTSSMACVNPTLNEAVVDYETATISWDSISSDYQLMYRQDISNEWSDTIYTTNNSYTLTNLISATNYIVQLRAKCNFLEGYSDWVTTNFTTEELPCASPVVTISDTTGEGATFSWGNGEHYIASQLHIFNTMLDTMINLTETSFTITGLLHATEYNVSVRIQCATNVFSEWCDTLQFTTLDCLPVTAVTVSNVAHDSAQISWTAEDGQTSWEINYGEEGFSQGEGTVVAVNTTNYTMIGLEAETNYDVYVRTVCGEDFYSVWTAAHFTTLEEPICASVSNVAVADVTESNATVTWTAVEGQTAWEVSYGVQGIVADEGIKVEVSTTTCQLSSLLAETSYDVYVRAICGDNLNSEWSTVVQFTTAATAICDPVTNVTITDITQTSAKVSWTAVEGQSAWELSYGVLGVDVENGTKLNANSTTLMLEDLQQGTAYDVYVRALCGDDFNSTWSTPVAQFSTLTDEPEGIDGVEGNFDFAIYPNPTSGATTISLNGVEGKVAISVVDMNGCIVVNESIECGVDCEKRIDVTNLSQGTYFVRVLGDNLNSVRKLIVR